MRHRAVTCASVLVCVWLIAGHLAAQIPQTERDALIALYNSTDGGNWTSNSGWLGPAGTECAWKGVWCSDENRVYRLYLSDNGLAGSIAPEIQDLTELELLSGSRNELSGSIPPEIGALSKLTSLSLGGNQLTGTIPVELGDLARLTSLYLDYNQLSGTIPPELGNLAALERLYLHSNDLSGTIPKELGKLANLQQLYLSGNDLSGTIPAELANLRSLKILALWSDNLTGTIPPELGRLANLEWLLLYRNNLTGSIPPEIGNLTKLQRIDLWENRLSGTIPPEIGRLESLEVAWLDDNLISGSIPAEIGSLTSVRELLLGGNQLTGPLPQEITNLTKLEWLILAFNGLYIDSAPVQQFIDSSWDFVFLESTQTAAPDDVTAAAQGTGSVVVTWTPIQYTANEGGYRVYYATSSTGPYALFGETVDKTVSWMTVDGLNPGQTYHFYVRTVTYPHAWNQGTVVSEQSAVVSSTTASAGVAGSVQIAFGSLRASEAESKEIVLRRLGGVGGVATVDYATGAGTATAGSDYLSSSGTISWPDGDGEPKTIVIRALDDASPEGDETLTLTLSNPTGGALLGSPTEATLTIADNDFEPDRESDPSSAGSDPAVASDPDGDRVVVWGAKSADAVGSDIYAQLYNADGDSVGAQLVVNATTAGDQHSPAVAMDASGRFLVVWLSDESTGKAAQEGNSIVAQLFSPGGQPEGDEIEIDDGSDGEIGSVDVAVRPASGRFVVVWSQSRTKAGHPTITQDGNTIVARFFDSNGEPAGGEIVIDDGSEGVVGFPIVAANDRGDTVAAWEREAADESTDVYATTFEDQGQAAGDPILVNVDTWKDQGSPVASMDSRGNFLVAWQGPSLADSSGGRESGTDVFARRYAAQGTPVGQPFRVNLTERNAQKEPRAVVTAQGDCWVAWESEDGWGSTRIFGRFLPACESSTKSLGQDLQLDAGDPDQAVRAPDIAPGVDGEVTVVYSPDDVDEGDGGVNGNVIVQQLPHGCQSGGLALCLNQSRFEVVVEWEDFGGHRGVGLAVPLTADTGYFWFFRDTNIELMVKVLDGTGINGYYWVFFGALSNVEYSITVTDTSTGNAVTYMNPSGNFASYADTSALLGESKGAHRVVALPAMAVSKRTARQYTELMHLRPIPSKHNLSGSCAAGSTTLCLNSSRFSVEVDWETTDERSGQGQAFPLTSDTGYFWFFRDTNVELVVKVLNGRPVNGHYWVFYGALSDVEYTITVTDSETGEIRTYHNPQGQMASVGDTQAFYVP